jgi:manganese-dependent inorganic pyrophosphatase
MVPEAAVWSADSTYVIGHQRPDTDAIAAALGYAWFLSVTGWADVVATRAGQPGAQTLFALERWGLEPPRLLTAVAPTFGHVARPQPPVAPGAPLSEAIARLAAGARVVPVVSSDGRPAGIVTALGLARAFSRPIGRDQVLAQPCREHLEAPPSFGSGDRISDHRGALLRSEADDFLVLDNAGQYLGLATRARVLEPPRARLVLVDHNELSQAVAGAEEAEIVAVLDHHRLSNPPTAAPIPFVVEPVGSTCTLVAEQCRLRALTPPPALAGMLLSGILSDTLVFRSPTTTPRDRAAADGLAARLRLDLPTYGEELLRAAPGLIARDPKEIVDSDRKSYSMSGRSVSVAQVEVTGMQELSHRREGLLGALEERRQREGLALIGLMVTDVVAGRSVLLCQGETRALAALPFARLGEGEYDLGDMVSRKKQLLPALHGALSDTG